MPKKEKGVRNTVTFPVDLYERITKLASEERRSISQQILYLCELGLEQLEKQKSQDK